MVVVPFIPVGIMIIVRLMLGMGFLMPRFFGVIVVVIVTLGANPRDQDEGEERGRGKAGSRGYTNGCVSEIH